MSELVKGTRVGEIGVITLNNPPVNALGPPLLEAVREALEAFRGDEGVQAVVLIGGGRAFSGGADINQFGKITSGQASREASPFPGLLEALEQFPRPIVAAIHGFAFGGGLELAMACHYRVALASFAQFAFDYQFIKNPAYATERGPVSIFTLQLHLQY